MSGGELKPPYIRIKVLDISGAVRCGAVRGGAGRGGARGEEIARVDVMFEMAPLTLVRIAKLGGIG